MIDKEPKASEYDGGNYDELSTLLETYPNSFLNSDLIAMRRQIDQKYFSRRGASDQWMPQFSSVSRYHDLVVILGSERGLWDESGYEPSPLIGLEGYDQITLDHLKSMREKHLPLLVEIILRFKHAVSVFSTKTIEDISDIVFQDWPQAKNPAVSSRLSTLRSATEMILNSRYQTDPTSSSD